MSGELYGLHGRMAEITSNDATSVTKATTRSYPLAYLHRVEGALWDYADKLGAEPLPVAELQHTRITPDEIGHRLEHTLERITGPGLADLPFDEKLTATRTLIGQIASMEHVPDDPNLLRSGLDASTRNFHINESGEAALVDLLPPLSTREGDAFPTDILMLPTTPISRRFLAWSMGTKTGVVTSLISSAIDRGESPIRKVAGAMRKVDDVWYDLLNQNVVNDRMRHRVRRQLQLRFVPYLTTAILQDQLKIRR